MFGKALCFLGWHKVKTNSGDNVARGWHCARSGCDYEVKGVKWPKPSPERLPRDIPQAPTPPWKK